MEQSPASSFSTTGGRTFPPSVVVDIFKSRVSGYFIFCISSQSHWWNLQLFTGVVLLHTDHTGKHPHEQRLQVCCDVDPSEHLFMVHSSLSSFYCKERLVDSATGSNFINGNVSSLSFLLSRIKGWWVSHHYVSTFLSGVMLTWWVSVIVSAFAFELECKRDPEGWSFSVFTRRLFLVFLHRPEGPMYQMFRSQFLAFSIYQSKRCVCMCARATGWRLSVIMYSSCNLTNSARNSSPHSLYLRGLFGGILFVFQFNKTLLFVVPQHF